MPTAGGQALLADVYVPRGQGAGPFPGVVFVHGGGWRGGSRKDQERQARYLAAHGYTVMSLEYRLAPGGHYADQMADCRAGIAWFKAHAAEYKLDAGRLGLVGISAGGHLAEMLALGLAPQGPDPAIKAEVSLSGVDNLDPVAKDLEISVTMLMGKPCAEDPSACRAASPVDNVHPGAPPILLMHGDSDVVALPDATRLMVERLMAAGDHVETFWAKGQGHPFWHVEPWILPVEEKMVAFLDKYVKGTK